jgi:hypothetical protein
MAWEQVAQARVSSSGVQGNVSNTLDELPVGTEGYLALSSPGIGPLMDMAGAEAIVQAAFWAKGVNIQVVDCYGQGFNSGYIRFKGSPVAVLAILVAVAAVLELLLYIGIVVVVGLFIWKVLGGVVGAFQKLVEHPWSIALIGGAVLGGIYLVSRRNK